MAAEGEAGRFVDRLEAAIGRRIGSGRSVQLAFSGGLGSLVVAAIARKRCDLSCLFAAADDAPDAARASVLQSYLDYRLEIVRPTPKEWIAMARRIGRDQPRWTVREILDAVPILAVTANRRGGFLAGHGSRRAGHAVRRWLAHLDVFVPIPASVRETGIRSHLIASGRVLGIPDEFLRVRPRSPEVGSGIGLLFREEARASRTSLGNLVRGPSKLAFAPVGF